MLTALIRTAVIYVVVILALRLMGKKQLGELQPSELVIAILISDIATLAIDDLSMPVISGIVPILMLVCLNVIMSKINLQFDGMRTVTTGVPRVVISDGAIDQAQLKDLRYTIDDLLESMRDCNIFDISQVQYAIVENTGKINFLEKPPAPPHLQAPENPPVVVIKDGKLSPDALNSAGLDQKWLRQTLFDNNVSTQGVFLLSVKDDKDYFLVKKPKKKGRL
ncbi:MAG: DUF421 domain-containing protein [Oscillospiraceae bacterium]|nr:DUF421 domain-containing protein [Oscillospiraceae bacterium]